MNPENKFGGPWSPVEKGGSGGMPGAGGARYPGLLRTELMGRMPCPQGLLLPPSPCHNVNLAVSSQCQIQNFEISGNCAANVSQIHEAGGTARDCSVCPAEGALVFLSYFAEDS